MAESHRGVWVAPWMGPNGELVVFAMTRRCRLIEPPLTVPFGADSVAITDALWDRLDAIDPPHERTSTAPRFARVARTRNRRGLHVIA